MNADYEKSRFNDQIVGKRIVMYDRKITPMGAEIMVSRNDNSTEELTKELISILFKEPEDDGNGRAEDGHMIQGCMYEKFEYEGE